MGSFALVFELLKKTVKENSNIQYVSEGIDGFGKYSLKTN